MSRKVAASGLRGNADRGSAAAICGRASEASQPATATPARPRTAGMVWAKERPASQAGSGRSGSGSAVIQVASAIQLPAAMPTSVAASDAMAKTPLAAESRPAGMVSAIVPIRLGFRSAD